MRWLRLREIFLLLWSVGCFSPAWAVTTSLVGESPIQVEADQFWLEGETNTYRAIGGVHITGEDLDLQAGEVSWSADSGEAIATGDINLYRSGARLQGDFMTFNLNTGLGELSQGEVLLEEDKFHFSGTRIVRTGERDYTVEGGTFTSCDPTDPDWQFVASSMQVHNARWASAKHVRFHVADIPLLYLPYLVYPIRYERESGFLEPDFGYSDGKGTMVSLVYYWAIAQNMDATIDLDYLSRIGLGKGLEYRYALSGENDGTLTGYHVNGFGDTPDSHEISWQHRGWLPGKVLMLADMEYVSDRDFLEDFGSVAEEYNQDLTESTLAFARAWRRSFAGIRFDYTQDLTNDNPGVLQRLPQLTLSQLRTRLWETPLFAGIDTTSTYFWREEGQSGIRLQLRPLLSADLHLGRYLSLEPEAAYLQRYYDTEDPSEDDNAYGAYELALRLKSELSRVFDVDGEQMQSVQHLFEPRLEYRYRSDGEQDKLPSFDDLDRTDKENLVELALVNRLTARLKGNEGEPGYHEFLQLRLSQAYDFDEQRRDVLPGDERRRPWGLFRSELIVSPTASSFIDLDARFDVNSGGLSLDQRLQQFDARAEYSIDKDNQLQLGYYSRDDEEKYLYGELDTSLLKPLYLSFTQRYDFREEANLERILRAEYRSSCWSVALTVTDRPDEQSFLVSFALGGFGELTTMGGGL